MADVSGTSQAYISAALTTQRTLAARTGAGATLAQKLPDGVSSNRFATHRATIPAGQVQGALSTAIYIAKSIAQALDGLVKSARLADGSLTNPDAGILVGYGTRLSVGNIQAGLDRTLTQIDTLVERAAVGAANILSSTSNDITLQTSVYGGALSVTPQPFDVAGLGLENLDLHTASGRDDALARLTRAQVIAGQRILNLEALRDGLNDPSALSSALNALDTRSGTVLGAIVDLTA